MSDFKTRMHQIRFPKNFGVTPLCQNPRWFYGAASRRGEGRGREGGERNGEGEEGHRKKEKGGDECSNRAADWLRPALQRYNSDGMIFQ